MNDLEKALRDEIPLHEAADYFIRVKQAGWPQHKIDHGAVEKTASAMKTRAQQVFDDLLAGKMPEGKAGRFEMAKTAVSLQDVEKSTEKRLGRVYGQAGASKGALEAGAAGALGGGALGAIFGSKGQKMRSALRAARASGAIGGVAGGAIGGVAGKKKGERVGAAVNKVRRAAIVNKIMAERRGRELEQVSGQNRAMRQAIVHHMQSKHKKASANFIEGLKKLGFGEDIEGQGGASAMPPPQAAQAPAPTPQPAPQAPPTMPTNYMGAELAGQRAQQMNEANFYREQLQQATAENQATQQQLADTMATVEQLQQQTAAAGEQIQAATQQAVEATDRALEHSQMAAKMRMGIQQIREQMLQVASQDPDAIAEAKANDQAAAQQAAEEAQAAQSVPPGQEQSAAAGAPGGAPEAGGGGQPGTVPAENNQGGGVTQGGSGESGSPVDATAQPQTQAKTGSMALPLAGAALGAGSGLLAASKGPQPEQAAPEGGGFTKAIRAAQAKVKQHPVGAALTGAAAGAMALPFAAGQAARVPSNIRRFQAAAG